MRTKLHSKKKKQKNKTKQQKTKKHTHYQNAYSLIAQNYLFFQGGRINSTALDIRIRDKTAALEKETGISRS